MKTMKHPEFARRLKEACHEAEVGPITKKALGKLFGVSGVMAWYYWNGEKLPSVERAAFIAEKLSVCVEWLLTGRGPKRPTDPIPGRDMIDVTDLSEEAKAHVKTTVSLLKGLGHSNPTSFSDAA